MESSTRPRVDFYVLTTRAPEERLRFACQLTEKIWKMGHRVFVNAGDEQVAATLDTLLWTFREDSFVPHTLAGDAVQPADPVLIGTGSEPAQPCEVLLNLAERAPAWSLEFGRVAELIPGDPASRAAGRDRYRYYRAQGCEVRSHDV